MADTAGGGSRWYSLCSRSGEGQQNAKSLASTCSFNVACRRLCWARTSPADRAGDVPPSELDELTVEMIEHVLAVLHTESDRNLARELDGHHLTQRLTAARFERLNSKLPGRESRQALLAIADEAAFLDLPPADQLDLPAPDRAAQGRMVSRAAAFVAATVSRMPDFTATRTTTRFQDAYVMRSSKAPDSRRGFPLHRSPRSHSGLSRRPGS